MLAKKRFFVLAILVVVAVATMADSCSGGSAQQQQVDQQNNNDAAARLHAAVPYPQLTNSTELTNQAARLKLLNDPNHVGYIYVIAYNLVFGPYQVVGKCSSTESLYSSPAAINTDHSYQGNGVVVVPAAQPDGSYGQNENAIFCFLDDAGHTYVEFSSQWIYTDKPLVGLPTVPGSAEVHNGK